jgi:hypothetical protein
LIDHDCASLRHPIQVQREIAGSGQSLDGPLEQRQKPLGYLAFHAGHGIFWRLIARASTPW